MTTTSTNPIDARLVSPGSLIIDANVRADTKIDRSFVSNIKQHGVLVPVLVEEQADTLHVLDGQRRVLAAVEAGLTSIPVLVSDGVVDGDRIIRQLIVNDHRAELTDVEHASAFKQLALFGISADAISRKTNLPKRRVELAIDVATSEAASTAMTTHRMTLDQAATVLEFQDDPTDVAALLDAAKAGQLEHQASRIRTRRTQESILATLEQQIRDAGNTPTPYPDYQDTHTRTIDRLWVDYEHGTRLTETAHTSCLGRAYAVDIGWEYSTGNKRVPRGQIVEVCTDWKTHGHQDPNTARATSNTGPLNDAEKARRRTARDNNKLWIPATEVRLSFIRELLQRTTLPTGWIDYVADFAANRLGDRSIHDRNYARYLLHIPDGTTTSDWLTTNPARSSHLLLAIAIASTESLYDYSKKGWSYPETPHHLAALSTWGYTLSDLEERVTQGTAGTNA